MYCTAGSSEQFSEIQFPTMSSPFSSLKKGKSPFLPGHIPGHRPIPFRHPEYSEDESRLLEEITTSMAASRMKAVDPFKGGLPTNFMDTSPNPSLVGINQGINNSSDPEPGSSTPTDRELMKLMMARLTVMEQKVSRSVYSTFTSVSPLS